MKKILFLFLVSWSILFAQAPILQNFTSESLEGQAPSQGLTNIAYRHVGDSLKRFVRVSLTSGSLTTITISTVIEPELVFQNLFEFITNNPIPFMSTPTGYQITITGTQIDQYINSTVGIANNFNGVLDPGEVLEISERSYVISCSVGDSNATSNQSLYSLSFGSQTALTQANTMVFTGSVVLQPRIFSDTFPGFCQDSVIRWEGAFINESNGVTNGTPFSQTAFHPTFYFRLAGQILDSLYLNGIKVNFLPIPGGCCNDYLYNLDSLCKWQNTTFGITNINADSFPEILPGDSLRFTLFTTISRCYSPMPENTNFTVGVS